MEGTNLPDKSPARNRKNHIREGAIIAAGMIFGMGLGLLFALKPAPAGQTENAASEIVPKKNLVRPHTAPPSQLEQERVELERKVTELEVRRLKERLAELEAEAVRAASPLPPPAAAAASKPVRIYESAKPASSAAALGARGEPTLAYWNALNDIISREAAMRTAPGAITAANAVGFVTARVQAGEYASQAIRTLNAQGVDSDAVTLGRELAAWYAEETANNRQAESLLGSADIAARQGQAGKSWQSREEQHRRKCDDLNRRGAALRATLTKRYGLAFPELK
jgi:hypothetical protein